MDLLPDPADRYAEYPISLRIVRFEIKDGQFENIITNLLDLEFDIGDFKGLHHLRWSEETVMALRTRCAEHTHAMQPAACVHPVLVPIFHRTFV